MTTATETTFAERAWGPIVAYVDRLGYLICVDCIGSDAPPLYDSDYGPVRARIGPHNIEPCERCGRIVNQPKEV